MMSLAGSDAAVTSDETTGCVTTDSATCHVTSENVTSRATLEGDDVELSRLARTRLRLNSANLASQNSVACVKTQWPFVFQLSLHRDVNCLTYMYVPVRVTLYPLPHAL